MSHPKEKVFSSKTLDYFLQLAETMNYTQAAQLLGITQPALTQQIKKLEKSIGTPLFYSVGKKLHLSEAGKTMLKTVHEIYEILNHATDEIQQTSSATRGRIRLGVLSSIEDKVFTDFIIHFYKQFPDIEVTLLMLNRKEIWEKLENNLIDLAVMYLPDVSIKNWKPYKTKKIMDDEVLLLHHDEKLMNKNKIKLKNTINKNWIAYPEGYYIYHAVKDSFHEQMADLPTVSARFTTPQQIYRFLKETDCYTALPKSFILAEVDGQHVHSIPLDPALKYKLSFVYRKDKDQIPRVDNFLNEFDQYLASEDYQTRLMKK